MINKFMSMIFLLILSFSSVAADEKYYVLIREADTLGGIEQLPQLGLEIHVLVVDAYESMMAEIRQEFSVIDQYDHNWLKSNAMEVSERAGKVVKNREKDIISAFQDKLRAAHLSKKYGIQTLPAILLVRGDNEYKLSVNQFNVADVYYHFLGVEYESL